MLEMFSHFHGGRKTTRRGVVFVSFLVLAGIAGAGGPVAYGTKLRFQKGGPLVFPDFDLTYLGKRRVASKVYPRGFLYHDFKVSRGGKSITVSWSSGTGDIGPQDFVFEGKVFLLEMSRSAKLGRLNSDEVVVVKK